MLLHLQSASTIMWQPRITGWLTDYILCGFVDYEPFAN
jgi:hypothetical protein